MKKLSLFLVVLFLFSCKPKQKIAENIPVKETKNETIANIIQNHYAVKRDFKTAFIKAGIDFQDAKQSLSLSADIRIKKDEIILVSVKFFGIVMAKAILTPTQVKYYEKAGGKFFEGDYRTISDLVGTDLNFTKAQNLLLGIAIDDLKIGKYELSTDQNILKLNQITTDNFKKSYVFDASNFYLQQQEVIQNKPQKLFLVNYTNFKNFTECVLPGNLDIVAKQEEKTTNINIEYKNAAFNEDLTFPYAVPSGYEQIKIN